VTSQSAAGESLPVSTSPRSRRSPLKAALLSFLWPGLGQLYLGQRFAALVFAIPALAVAVWAALELRQGMLMIAASMLDETYAFTVLTLAALIGVWRGAAIVHAYFAARPTKRLWALDGAVLSVLLVSIVAMHGVVAVDARSFYDLDRTLAQSGENEPTPDPTELPTVRPTWLAVETVAATLPTPSPSPVPPPPSDRVTVLLTGVDFIEGRHHHLNDSIMVVSVNTKTGKVAMVSVPRDVAGFPLYWGGYASSLLKINRFYAAVQSKDVIAPDPPRTALIKQVAYLIGIPIDYYAEIDMDGFRQLVDLVGGVDVVNPKAINDPFTGTILPAGPLHLDGATALKYVRSREGSGDNDYTRSGRQQDVLVALEQKMASPAVLPQLPELLGLAGRTIQTDFPLKTARSYVSLAQSLGEDDITQCVLGPPYAKHPSSIYTKGVWTLRLDQRKVAGLSVYLFGKQSRYYGWTDLEVVPCPTKPGVPGS
jgi:LCP family protein required for cell wall assembly